ncbi:MAG: aminoglycoside phosphotransferase family protein, partial [Gammaproteobacteria bacterium]
MNIGEVLSGRAKSNGVRWLLLSPTAQQVLADQVRALLPAGARVGPCRLREAARFKPGRGITAYYDAFVNTEGRQEDDVRPIAVTWGANTQEDRHAETVALAKVQAEAVGRGVAAPFRQLMADFSEWTMRVWVSPLDTRFTQLVRFSDPQHVRAVLANTGVAASDQHRTSEYTIRFLKYRPGMRHVLRYDPLDPVDEPVFAKLYIVEDGARAYRREDAARAFRVASKAADWLAEHGNNASCLRPLAHVAEDAVVLYPRAVGTPMSDYIQRSVGTVAPWLKRSGEALCSLHQMPAALADPLGPPHDFAAEIRLIAKKNDRISTLLPDLGSGVGALLDRAQELHARLPQEPPTFTHGDLKSEHIWVAPGRLTFMDFDSAHWADPALDVGYFLADCQFLHPAHDQAGLEQLHESFLAGYAPGVPKERLIRARLYEATGLIKCAVRRVPFFEHDWVSRTAALLGRAEAVLNDLQSALVMPRYTSAATEPEESNEGGSSEPIVQSAVDSALVAPSTGGEPDIAAL